MCARVSSHLPLLSVSTHLFGDLSTELLTLFCITTFQKLHSTFICLMNDALSLPYVAADHASFVNSRTFVGRVMCLLFHRLDSDLFMASLF